MLRANLAALEVGAAAARVSAADYRRALKADAARARLYTLVLIDAPYALYPAVELELAGRLPACSQREPSSSSRRPATRRSICRCSSASVKLYGDTRVTFLQARF